MTDAIYPARHPFSDGFADAFEACWQLLDEGAKQRKSSAHTPVLATLNRHGKPDQRVLVLRAADRKAGRLRFHTDARSLKMADIGNGKAAHVLVYDAASAQQLRLGGVAETLQNGADVDAAWMASTAFARRCYLATAAPGTIVAAPTSGLPDSVVGREPSEAELIPARAHFALIRFTILSIDWLHLANSGHRRALFERETADACWQAQWRIP